MMLVTGRRCFRFFVAPASRRQSAGVLARRAGDEWKDLMNSGEGPVRGRDALATAGKMPALHPVTWDAGTTVYLASSIQTVCKITSPTICKLLGLSLSSVSCGV